MNPDYEKLGVTLCLKMAEALRDPANEGKSIGELHGIGARAVIASSGLLEEVERLRATVNKLESTLEKTVTGFGSLVDESGGVYGLHLNGDAAPWGELTAGGRFECWTGWFYEADEVLNKLKTERILNEPAKGPQ